MSNIKILGKLRLLRLTYICPAGNNSIWFIEKHTCIQQTYLYSSLSPVPILKEHMFMFQRIFLFFPHGILWKISLLWEETIYRLSLRYTIAWRSYTHFMNIKWRVALHGRVQRNITAEVENQESFAELFSWVWSSTIYCCGYGLDYPECYCLQQLTLFLLFQNEGLLLVKSGFIHLKLFFVFWGGVCCLS